MKSNSYSLLRAVLLLCACLSLGAVLSASAVVAPLNNTQDPYGRSESQTAAKETPKDKKKAVPELSEGEAKMALKINSAPDAAAKLQAAEEFLKKYPKTAVRAEVMEYVSGQIGGVPEATQKIALSEKFLTLFPEPAAADLVNPILINAYLASNRAADAFRVAAPWIEKNPSDVGVLINLANAGAQPANNNNPQVVAQSRQYGLKAIELIEADQKPARMDDALWKANKEAWRAQLYQTVGFLALVAGDKPEGLARLEKAIALNPTNPNNYAVIGDIKNEEYKQIAAQYKSMPAGAEQDALLKKAYAKLDEIIDLYAHVVALSEGNAQLQRLHDTYYNDLKSYYAYRHNNSTDGLQQLIDKYKVPSKPQ